jgi:hypothetical protein
MTCTSFEWTVGLGTGAVACRLLLAVSVVSGFVLV